MKTYTKEELANILDLHAKWTKGIDGGVKADLRGSDLRDCNLRGCDLRGSDLRYCELRGSDLRYCELRGSDLRYCNLRGCDLRDCDLRDCDLSGSDLRYCDLSGCNLRGCELRGCDLSGSDLSGSDLRYCDLSGCNLRGCDLHGCNLRGCKTYKRYIQISCIGSRKGMTTYCFEDNFIWCGCFKGTLEEFENQVKNTHAENKQYLAEYLGFINYIKSLINVEQ